jgi:hypothetical protein
VRRVAAAAAPAKPAVVVRTKPPVAIAAAPAAAAHAPLVIAQADQNDATLPSDRLARDPNSLLAKTLDLKDHVVDATRHVVSAIGEVFASIGGHIGGTNPDAGPATRQFSSAS